MVMKNKRGELATSTLMIIIATLILLLGFLFIYFNELNKKKGKFTYKDGSVYEGYFEDDKMTSSPTFIRNSKISDQISKIKTRILKADPKIIEKAIKGDDVGTEIILSSK